MENKVKCDNCNEFFELSENCIKERAVSPEFCDIREKYFECPHCNHHYYIIITDNYIKQIIQRRKTLQTIIKSKYRGSNNSKQIMKLMKEDNDLKKLIEEKTAEFKSKYIKNV